MPRIGIIVLAAGQAVRFGGARDNKLLAALGGVPLVRWAVTAAVEADVGDVLVVTGAKGREVAAALDGLPVQIVHEPGFANGIATSLCRGIRAIQEADAAMIGLGDQPGMRPEAYRRLATRWQTTRARIVIPRYAGSLSPAHPALFGAALFEELLALRGDAGARAVIARDASRVVEEPLEWFAPPDVDTLDDLRALETEQSQLRVRPPAPLQEPRPTETGDSR